LIRLIRLVARQHDGDREEQVLELDVDPAGPGPASRAIRPASIT
jgi:hypothetical protein